MGARLADRRKLHRLHTALHRIIGLLPGYNGPPSLPKLPLRSWVLDEVQNDVTGAQGRILESQNSLQARTSFSGKIRERVARLSAEPDPQPKLINLLRPFSR